MNEPQREFFVCNCKHHDHMMFVEIWPEHEDSWPVELSFQVLLNPQPWYLRIKPAISHLLGRTAKYSTWDEILIEPKDAIQLISILNEYLEMCGHNTTHTTG